MRTHLKGIQLISGEKGCLIGQTMHHQMNGFYSVGLLQDGTFIHFNLADKHNNHVLEVVTDEESVVSAGMHRGLNKGADIIFEKGLSMYVGTYLKTRYYAENVVKHNEAELRRLIKMGKKDAKKVVTFEAAYEPSGESTDINVAHAKLLELFEVDTECIRLYLNQNSKRMLIEFFLVSA